jgi:CheY-like chemotaxis protein
VTLAPSLAEGPDRLHDRIPDLAFIDFGRGVQSRVDALEMLRRDPALRHLPIVLLLRNGEDAATGDELQVGAKDFVVNVDHVATEASRAVWSGPPRTPYIE